MILAHNAAMRESNPGVTDPPSYGGSSMRSALLGLVALLTATASCSSAADQAVKRAPVEHRAAGTVCPPQRAMGISDIGPACSQGSELASLVHCTQDSDCTSGANGRCLQFPGPACNYGCSYDECSADSDCTGNAPCVCRSSSADTAANTCESGSNCRVDADCGPGGFCSPSMLGGLLFCDSYSFCPSDGGGSCSETGPDGVTKAVACECPGNCGQGYFCHTPKDRCRDDGDCAMGSCIFDLTSQSWMCAQVSAPS